MIEMIIEPAPHSAIEKEITEIENELIEDIYNPGEKGRCPPQIAFNVGRLMGTLARCHISERNLT